jgi:hypothetical protein
VAHARNTLARDRVRRNSDFKHPLTDDRPEWLDLPPAELAAFLRDRPTLPNTHWTDAKRLPGESRDAFISRVLGTP